MPPLAAVPDLERELDALYALPLEEFTRARNDLVARLRKAHQSEAATDVHALRKPTVVAWAANHLARAHPDLVAQLVDAGGRLRDAQQRALAGTEDRDGVAGAAASEREALRALVSAARTDLGARATPQVLDRLTRTLRAAAVEPDLAARLAAGRLTEELQAVGFGPLEAVPTRRDAPSIDRRAERERVAALRTEAQRLADDARNAESAAAAAERDAAHLREAASRLRLEADRAAQALADAESSARRRR